MLGLLAVGLGAYWLLTRPAPLSGAQLSGALAAAEAVEAGGAATPGASGLSGQQVFDAAGCASCHAAPGAEPADRPVLAGGKRFATPFGTFVAPNISPDPKAGIGAWTDAQLMNAIMRGISPGGAHYYPAFPYATYGRADPADIALLVAHLRGLPADATPSQPHEIGFPFNIRRNMGIWKRLFVDHDWVVANAAEPQIARGRYLVEALAHCGECHTPRNALGGIDRGAWLSGAPNPTGKGRIPDITPRGLSWSEADIANYLKTGFTPEYDTAGAEMAEVVENLSKLPETELKAIAAYLKSLPAGSEGTGDGAK
ncbi:cytochrome c [Brevirhabdus pacifica]|nr:cytochrome c [Brevirhabdus pacifica]